MIKVLSTLLVLTLALTACNSSKKNNSIMKVEKQSISTTINTSKSNYSLGEPIQVSFEAQNNTGKDFEFLPWGTPLENRLTNDCFEVTFNNLKLPYRGIMVKRAAPTEKDNIIIKNGDKANGHVNLIKSYNFASKGEYTIQFKESHLGLATSNKLNIIIE